MARLNVDQNALQMFQDRRAQSVQRALEILGFVDADEFPHYCTPVLNEIEIPLSIASFARDKEFLPPINFLIHIDEYDSDIPAGRHAKLLSSYLLDAKEFGSLRILWFGLLQVRYSNYQKSFGTQFNNYDYRMAIHRGVEFFIRCLAKHNVDCDKDLNMLRPMLDGAEIRESDLDLAQ